MRPHMLVIAFASAGVGCLAVQSMAGKQVFGIEQMEKPPGEPACNLTPGTNRYSTTVHLRYYIKATQKGGYVMRDGRMQAVQDRVDYRAVPDEVLAEARKLGAAQLAPCLGTSAAAIASSVALVGHRIEGVNETDTVRTRYGSTTDPNMRFWEVFLAVTVAYQGGARR